MLLTILMSKQVTLDTDFLKAALTGYGSALKEITRRIAALECELNSYKDRHRLKYKMSPEARRRISEAQKARWQQYRSHLHG